MADWAKIAVKLGLIAVFMVGIWALLTQVTIPTINVSPEIIDGISFAKTFFTYWLPSSPVIFGFGLAIIGFNIGIWLFKLAVLAAKWLKVVNQ